MIIFVSIIKNASTNRWATRHLRSGIKGEEKTKKYKFYPHSIKLDLTQNLSRFWGVLYTYYTMKTETKPAITIDKANSLSIIELANQYIPNGKFKGLAKLLDPHEQPPGGPAKTPKRG